MVGGKKYSELRKSMTLGWWLSNRHYAAYMMRELTSFFILVFSLLYIYQVALLRTSPTSYNDYLDVLKSPGMILFSVVALVFTLYHSFTWFYLTGKIQPIKVGRMRSTPLQVLIVNTVLMVMVSLAVIELLVVRG